MIPADVRIARLRAIDRGRRNGPEGYAVHETQVTNNSSFHTQEDAPSRAVGRQS